MLFYSDIINYMLCGNVPFSAGHGRSGGVQRDAGAVHAQGRRLPPGLLGHRYAELREHTPLPHSDPARQGPVGAFIGCLAFLSFMYCS